MTFILRSRMMGIIPKEINTFSNFKEYKRYYMCHAAPVFMIHVIWFRGFCHKIMIKGNKYEKKT